jgi:hypothetical protein
MTCPECGDRLQQWLDGRTRDAGPSEPLVLCPACAEWAGAACRLDRGLRLLTPPVPAPYLADRIVAAVAARRRRRRVRVLLWAGAAATAATLLIAAWQAFHHGSPPAAAPEPTPMTQTSTPPQPAPPPEAHATLRESVAEAGSAVASLTSRTADETVAKTKILIPAVVDPSLGNFDLQPPIDPPKLTLRETGEGVSAGLEPVADSARRAVGLFLRELPPMESAPKGGL